VRHPAWRRLQMGAVMKIKEARAKAIAEGATPESVGATHPHALPLKPEDIVVPRAKMCPQMDPRGAAAPFGFVVSGGRAQRFAHSPGFRTQPSGASECWQAWWPSHTGANGCMTFDVTPPASSASDREQQRQRRGPPSAPRTTTSGD
jgi:hypothetical protein